MCGLTSDLVISNFEKKHGHIHDTQCPYWDQVSLNNTNPTLKLDEVVSAYVLNPKVDIPLFAANTNPLQLYHSPWRKMLAFKDYVALLVIVC